MVWRTEIILDCRQYASQQSATPTSRSAAAASQPAAPELGITEYKRFWAALFTVPLVLLIVLGFQGFASTSASSAETMVDTEPAKTGSSIAQAPLTHTGSSSPGTGTPVAASRAKADEPALPKPTITAGVPATPAKQPGKDVFVVSVATDNRGRVWVGTEDQGVYCYAPSQPKGKQWVQFTTKHGLGDNNAYAIACDRQGRIWVSHLNHGVSVYNGQGWANYNILNGPIGERVFDIAVNPKNGDVWMATSGGLTRYCIATKHWKYYTRLDGLPEDQANAIAVDSRGTVYVGTQCHGIAICMPNRQGDYKTWRVVQAPKGFGPGRKYPIPFAPTGTGLPTNQINDLLIAKDGTIYAATTTGLAWSKNRGLSWRFLRGKDWAAKLKGLFQSPIKKKTKLPHVKHPLLPRDYLTSLADDSQGRIWFGTRQTGCGWINPKTQTIKTFSVKTSDLLDNYVSTVAALPDGKVVAGQYPGGICNVRLSVNKQPKSSVLQKSSSGAKPTQFPKPSQLSNETLSDIAGRLQKSSRRMDRIASRWTRWIVLGQDWITQGDWLGRYGRSGAILCAYLRPHDLTWGKNYTIYRRYLGAHAQKDDAIRHWLHWMYTSNPRSLEMPINVLELDIRQGKTVWEKPRRQSEWDDHGEVYPQSFDGPHMYCDIKIESAPQIVSLYFFNKDGHLRKNRERDYLIRILPGRKPKDVFSRSASRQEEQHLRSLQAIATARVRQFWGGVYLRFLVTKPGWYTIQFNRNNSFNTNVSGIFLDPPVSTPWGEPFQGKLLDRFQDENPDESPKRRDVDPILLLDPVQKPIVSPRDLLKLVARTAPSKQREGFLWVARLYLADSTKGRSLPRRELQHAYYHLHLFSHWEAGIKALCSMRTPRQKALKRDRLRGTIWMTMDQLLEDEKKAKRIFRGDTK